MPEIIVALVVGLVMLSVRALRARNGRESKAQAVDTTHMRARLIASCVVFAIISIPHILRVVPPNGIYGFRTAETLSSRAIWYPANAFMGWALLASSAIGAAFLLVLPATVKRGVLWAAFLTPIAGALLASFIYLKHLTQ